MLNQLFSAPHATCGFTERGQGFLDYTEKELPAESPPQFGLHPNAEIGYLTNSCETLFKAILNIAGQRHGRHRHPN